MKAFLLPNGVGDPTVSWHVGLSWMSDQIRHVRRSVPGLQSILGSDHSWHIRRSVPAPRIALSTVYKREWSLLTYLVESIRITLYSGRVSDPTWHIRRRALVSLSTVYVGSILAYPEECQRIALSTEYKIEWPLLTYPEQRFRITLYNVRMSDQSTYSEWCQRIVLSTEYKREWSLMTYPEKITRITLYSVQVISPDISGVMSQDCTLHGV